MVVSINEEGCKGCGYCVGACTRGFLRMGEKTNARGHFYVVENIDSENGCNECGLCDVVCPDLCFVKKN